MPLAGVHAPISVVAWPSATRTVPKEWREGDGESEVAFRTERIERGICRAVAEYAFRLAERSNATVFGGPKYTVSPTYEGMLKRRWTPRAARIRRSPTAAADRCHVRAGPPTRAGRHS